MITAVKAKISSVQQFGFSERIYFAQRPFYEIASVAAGFSNNKPGQITSDYWTYTRRF